MLTVTTTGVLLRAQPPHGDMLIALYYTLHITPHHITSHHITVHHITLHCIVLSRHPRGDDHTTRRWWWWRCGVVDLGVVVVVVVIVVVSSRVRVTRATTKVHEEPRARRQPSHNEREEEEGAEGAENRSSQQRGTARPTPGRAHMSPRPLHTAHAQRHQHSFIAPPSCTIALRSVRRPPSHSSDDISCTGPAARPLRSNRRAGGRRRAGLQRPRATLRRLRQRTRTTTATHLRTTTATTPHRSNAVRVVVPQCSRRVLTMTPHRATAAAASDLRSFCPFFFFSFVVRGLASGARRAHAPTTLRHRRLVSSWSLRVRVWISERAPDALGCELQRGVRGVAVRRGAGARGTHPRHRHPPGGPPAPVPALRGRYSHRHRAAPSMRLSACQVARSPCPGGLLLLRPRAWLGWRLFCHRM